MRTHLTLPPSTLGTISTDTNYAPPRAVNNTPVMAKALNRLQGEAVTIIELPRAFARRDPAEVLAHFYPGMDLETLRNHPLLEAARLRVASGSGMLVLPQILDSFERSAPAMVSRSATPTLTTPGKVVMHIPFARVKTSVAVMPSAQALSSAASKRCDQAAIDFKAGRIGSVRVDDIASQQRGQLAQLERSRGLFGVYTTARAAVVAIRDDAMRSRDVTRYNALTAQIEALDNAANGVLNEGYNPEQPLFTNRAQALRVAIYSAERALGMSPADARASVFAPRVIVESHDPLANMDNYGLEG